MFKFSNGYKTKLFSNGIKDLIRLKLICNFKRLKSDLKLM